MKKILIIDGHSILNRAFYGLPDLTNHEGLHTNAVLGFLNIIFKIMDEENPDHMCVAFDVKQPTFRHEVFKEYKGTRKPMPAELHMQVPLIKEVLAAMKITTIEKGGYEADDLIGTISRIADKEGYKVVIVSGDRDLLQLATDTIMVRIPKTKQGGTVVENYYAKDVEALYGVTPVQFIDMKGLMGDASDNIPGVPGIGEKTASKIIQQYGSVENAIAHASEIKPAKAQNNLIEYSEQAILSKQLATIKLDCDIELNIDDTDILDIFNEDTYNIFKRLEFKSLLNRFEVNTVSKELKPDIKVITKSADLSLVFDKAKKNGKLGVYVINSDEYFMGLSVSPSDSLSCIIQAGNDINEDVINDFLINIANNDVKVCFVNLKEALKVVHFNENTPNIYDVGVAAYLINPMQDSYEYDDLSRDFLGINLPDEKEMIGKQELNLFTFISDEFTELFSYKSIVPYMSIDIILDKLLSLGLSDLYYDIELPTIYSLFDMETRGIRVDRQALNDYSRTLCTRIDELTKNIISYAGHDFNINSPKQLGPVLFEEMGLPGGKKTKTGYSTSVDVLEKIKNEHPIIPDILEYRQLTKLNSTYAEGLVNYISDDNRIHGTFNQTITATGRISSTEPNLQNIPMRMELGRLIRKAFIPEDGFVFVDADYSQIELRVLAHMSKDEVMQNAFLENVDIHSQTASEVFDVPVSEVTSLQRRNAKAVNFGIVYGISAFGLSEDLQISRKEASSYIDKYFETYKSVKSFLDEQVKHAKENGYVKTMYGRIRPVPEINSSNFMQRGFGERVAMNSPIQGTAADIIKLAMIKVNMKLKSLNMKSRLILQIHDELLIETAEDELEEVKAILTEEMMNAAKLSIPLEIGLAVGNNWYDAK